MAILPCSRTAFPRRQIDLRLMLLLLVAAQCCFPQTGRAQIRLGPLTYPTTMARPLDVTTLADELQTKVDMTIESVEDIAPRLAARLDSFAYVSNIGGLAFGGVASGQGGARIVGLEYLPGEPDGKRLQVHLQTGTSAATTVTADLYDWELVPIAKFAATNDDACFTLFGRLTDAEETKARRDNKERILNYHKAFENTLLGLRLFQSDILILRAEAAELPSLDGEYLLGAGEPPIADASGTRPAIFDTYENLLAKYQETIAEKNAGATFTSYVICDKDQRVTFQARGKTLTLKGEPIWYCWRRKIQNPVELKRAEDKATEVANAKANEEANEIAARLRTEEFDADKAILDKAQVQLEKDQVLLKNKVTELNAKVKEFNAKVAVFNKKWSDENQKKRHNELFAPQFQPIFDRVADEELTRALLQPMPTLTKDISQEVRKQKGINPYVYNALVKTMQYSALFRHARQSDPEMYEAFVQSLADIPLEPAVETPAAMREPSIVGE